MTPDEAKNILLHHSFAHEDTSHPKSTRGFLGMLRPFNGELVQENYHEVMEAIKVLHVSLEREQIDREIIASLWAICYLGRSWAIDKNGMLRSNNLISQEQVDLMEAGINNISYAVFCLLDGAGVDEAFDGYDDAQ